MKKFLHLSLVLILCFSLLPVSAAERHYQVLDSHQRGVECVL